MAVRTLFDDGKARALCAVAVAWATTASVGAAQRVHAFGPAGTAEERRVMAVLEDATGACVAVAGVRWDAAEATVHEEAPASACVAWLRIRTDGETESVSLRARAGETEASVTVPMTDEARLHLHAERQGERLRVRAEGAAPDETLSGFVITASGTIALERQGQRELEAHVPEEALLGVVVRSETMVGVTAVPPRRAAARPEVLVLPASLAIEAGGPPREAAFLVTVDARGRLSQDVPLNVQSERGQLHSMRWLEPGIAAVGLSAPVTTESVDLRVGERGDAFAEAELAVTAQWPGAATIAVPAAVGSGHPFEIHGRGISVGGAPLDGARLRARCDDGEFEALPARCAGRPGPTARVVTLGALVDDRVVPLARATVDVVAPSVAAAPPTLAEGPTVELAAYARGAVDLWERPGGAAGLRAWLRPVAWLGLGVGLEYAASQLAADGRDRVDGALGGARHSVSAALLAEIAFGEELGGAVRIELGGGWTRAVATLDQRDASGDTGHLTARLAAGPRLRLGGWRLGLDVGAEVGTDMDRRAWDRAPLGGFLEFNGAARLP